MPMNLLLTGATGFVGRPLVQELLKAGHQLTLVSRQPPAGMVDNTPSVHWLVADLHDPAPLPVEGRAFDMLLHLAWPGLPNYRDLFHLEKNLPASYRWIRHLVDSGLPRVLVTGTCLEYGQQFGPLKESTPPRPDTSYGLAKHQLHEQLQLLQRQYSFTLQWVRLFYLHGPGQSPRSLLALLDQAMARGDCTFPMSGGEQLRDYLPIDEVARRLSWLVDHAECHGTINCCRGKPISVRRLVEQHIARHASPIHPRLGQYPYPDYEPLAFWGHSDKLPPTPEFMESHEF